MVRSVAQETHWAGFLGESGGRDSVGSREAVADRSRHPRVPSSAHETASSHLRNRSSIMMLNSAGRITKS